MDSSPKWQSWLERAGGLTMRCDGLLRRHCYVLDTPKAEETKLMVASKLRVRHAVAHKEGAALEASVERV